MSWKDAFPSILRHKTKTLVLKSDGQYDDNIDNII